MPRDTKGKAVPMAHMERTKAEKKEREKAMDVQSDAPDYPYGLRIHLDHDGMKKCGIADMPEVGGEVQLHAKAHVTSARMEKREGSEDERHLELQITHLGVHHKADGMKSEDQGGSGKTPNAGKVTDKTPNYSRKRN